MTPPRQQALARLRFNFAETPDDVWHVSPSHVDNLHTRVQHQIRAGIADAGNSRGASPIGLVLQGRKGVGKTHMLGSVRRMVQDDDGYFFLIQLTTGVAFWEDVATAMRSELLRTDDRGELQLTELLRRLCAKAGVPESLREIVIGDARLTPDDLNRFVVALRRVDARVAMDCDDTIRALVLCATADGELTDLGKDYLAGWRGSVERWGLGKTKQPRAVVAELSRVLALTGPSVVAFDQLDSLLDLRLNAVDEQVADQEVGDNLALIASGLMQLRETTQRTLSIVACLPDTWQLLNSVAATTVQDRFTETPILSAITEAEVGRELVVKWLAPVYDSLAFTPPHPTWPVAPSAFGGARFAYTPRQLLRRIQEHAEACLYGEMHELTSFAATESLPEPPAPAPNGPEPTYFDDLDRRFAALGKDADVASALRKETVDVVMPDLLQAALKSWITEVGNDDRSWETEPPPDGDRQVHAGLRRLLDEERDVVQRWVFRAIAPQHGNGVLRKIREATSAAGIREGVRNRHLVLLYQGEQGWGGAKTVSVVDDLAKVGSPRFEITETDIRTFSALRELLKSQTYELLNWLVVRKPASKSAFLREILSVATATTTPPVVVAGGHEETRPPPAVRTDEIVFGLDGEVTLTLEALRKHAVVFAGSGAGKTVLLRRVVEECALRGVSAIVLDPNNDLARLGEAWPQPPQDWRPEDAASAAEYVANTEVVVWTPGRAGGRPLTFHPLPDFDSVRDDEDEFTASVDAAVAALVPHARVTGSTKAAIRGQAVLKEALTHYARWGGRSLSGFIDVLTDLPDGVSKLTTATKTAADLAETLRAAMVNDPLLAGTGEPVDPALLLTPSAGKRARVSVISFVGLPGEEQRQAFISQLQLEVFAWIKRHPAVDRPLCGLLVMDEAQTIAPSGTRTASTQSTILLASQARKYGLALLLATQAPKGLHNQVIGNATTQFFGRLNSPAQIAAANDMARAKSSTVGDISRLERGQFYVTGEGFGFKRMRAPLCLSHHPPAPLRLEEVLDRARG